MFVTHPFCCKNSAYSIPLHNEPFCNINLYYTCMCRSIIKCNLKTNQHILNCIMSSGFFKSRNLIDIASLSVLLDMSLKTTLIFASDWTLIYLKLVPNAVRKKIAALYLFFKVIQSCIFDCSFTFEWWSHICQYFYFHLYLKLACIHTPFK